MATVPLSVVVITKNEERNIEDCLNSVYGWADEIVVVDDESKDRTVELAACLQRLHQPLMKSEIL